MSSSSGERLVWPSEPQEGPMWVPELCQMRGCCVLGGCLQVLSIPRGKLQGTGLQQVGMHLCLTQMKKKTQGVGLGWWHCSPKV